MPTEQSKPAEQAVIDMRPSWGDVGRMLWLLLRDEEYDFRKCAQDLQLDLAKALAAAETLYALRSTLTPEQEKLSTQVFERELRKQGFKPDSNHNEQSLENEHA